VQQFAYECLGFYQSGKAVFTIEINVHYILTAASPEHQVLACAIQSRNHECARPERYRFGYDNYIFRKNSQQLECVAKPSLMAARPFKLSKRRSYTFCHYWTKVHVQH